MSSGPSNTTTTSEPPKYAQPFYKDYLQQGSNIARAPYQPYDASRVAGFNSVQNEAMGGIYNRAMQGNPLQGQAQGELSKTIGGGYSGMQAPANAQADVRNEFAGPNPYLEGMINASSGDLTRNYNNVQAPSWQTAQGGSGSFGNAGLAEMETMDRSNLQRNIGDISREMRFGDYTQQQGLAENRAQRQFAAGEGLAGRQFGLMEGERGRQMQALGLAPEMVNMDYADLDRLAGVGDALENKQQSYLDDDYSRFTEARDYPLRQLGILGSTLGQPYGQSQSSSGPGPNRAAGTLGGALAGAQMGSIFPGVGTGIGAAGGALIGLLGSRG